MKKIICLALTAVILLALTACGGNTDPTAATPDEPSNAPTVAATADEISVDTVVFDFSDRSTGNVCVAGGSVFVGNNTGIYLADNGEMKKISDAPADKLCSVSDTIYYIVHSVTGGEEYYELHQINPDGSDDKKLCGITEDSSVKFIMQTGHKIYLTNSIKTISVYDTEADTLTEAFIGYYDNVSAIGNKIYFTASEGLSSPVSLYCYDTVNDKAAVISDQEYDNSSLYLNGENLYVTIDFDNYNNSGSCDIYKINTQTDGIDKLCAVSVDDSLIITDIVNDTVFYQNYSEKDGRFQTFTMSLPDGAIKPYESIDYLLTNNLINGSNVCCFGTPDRKYRLVYDFDKAEFRSVSTEDSDNEWLSYDSVIIYESQEKIYRTKPVDEDTAPSAVPLTLSDNLPKAEDMYNGSESSPDNEYLKLNKLYITRSGSCFWIPELTLSSDDAAEVNNELDNGEYYGYGQYYKSELHDNYLTFYTLTLGESSSRTYKLYTFEVTTGKRLDNDEIIALVAYNKDSFYDAIKDRIRELQEDIFKGLGTEIENRNENKEATGYTNEHLSITDDMYDYALTEEVLNKMQLGYAGDGKLLCVSGFRNIAGGYATDHLFEFEYGA